MFSTTTRLRSRGSSAGWLLCAAERRGGVFFAGVFAIRFLSARPGGPTPRAVATLTLQPQHRHRACLQLVSVALSQSSCRDPGIRRIDERLPPSRGTSLREDERFSRLSRIEDDKQRIAYDALAAFVGFVDRFPVQPHRERANVRGVPHVVGHLSARCVEPGDIRYVRTTNPPPLQELAPAEDRVLLPDAEIGRAHV